MTSALGDQLLAAELEVGGIAESIRLGLNAAHVAVGDVERAAILQALEGLPRCQHLQAIPVQPALVLMTVDPVVECKDCFESAEVRRFPCCPACGLEAVQPLKPAALPLGHWLVVWLLCHSCMQASVIR